MTQLQRMFFALWPDDAWRSRLLAAAAPLLSATPGRALASDDLHVTLCFLGAVGEPQLAALCARAGQIQAGSFALEFERLEWWRQARIVAATVARVPPEGLQLAQMLAAAASEAGLSPDRKPWRPHITLARGVTPARWPVEPRGDAWPLPPLKLRCARFYLAQSQGLGAQGCDAPEARRYVTRASWSLRA